MTFDFYAETNKAKFLDFIDKNKDKIIEFLKLEEEELLFEIYNNPRWIE
jgi:hypothetical protein